MSTANQWQGPERDDGILEGAGAHFEEPSGSADIGKNLIGVVVLLIVGTLALFCYEIISAGYGILCWLSYRTQLPVEAMALLLVCAFLLQLFLNLRKIGLRRPRLRARDGMVWIVCAGLLWGCSKVWPIPPGTSLPRLRCFWGDPADAPSPTPLSAVDFQRKVTQAMSLAKRQYPELRQPRSAFTVEFVRRLELKKATQLEYFEDPQWPLVLAKECQESLASAPAQ